MRKFFSALLLLAAACVASAAPGNLPFTLGTYTATGCSNTNAIGGTYTLGPITFASGSFKAGISGTCTVTFTLPVVNHTWACTATNTTSQVLFIQTINGTTTCTVSAAAVSGDTITFIGVGT